MTKMEKFMMKCSNRCYKYADRWTYNLIKKCHFRISGAHQSHSLVRWSPGMSATQPIKAESTHWHATFKKQKKELQAFLSMINYLGKFSLSIPEVWESLTKLTSAKTEGTWNATYQKMFDKGKAIIKEDTCRKYYDETKPLHIEKDVSGVWLGAALL